MMFAAQMYFAVAEECLFCHKYSYFTRKKSKEQRIFASNLTKL
jgi:hypothetical protein